jgi:hypothetical protein
MVSDTVRAGDDHKVAFERFCAEWMQKLAARERDNKQQIRWVPNESGVEGEYIGYSSQHECSVKVNSGGKNAVPVGKIKYHEFRYQKTGVSPDAAHRSQARALEAVEVTEIFRYASGRWRY